MNTRSAFPQEFVKNRRCAVMRRACYNTHMFVMHENGLQQGNIATMTNRTITPAYTLEFTTWPGLLPALCDELDALDIAYSTQEHSARIRVRQPWQVIPRVACAQAAFVLCTFAIPRPKALLGQQYWDEIVHVAREICSHGTFQTLELDAAGADSAVMQRIHHTLAEALHLKPVTGEGDLQMRIRRGAEGWDVLLRATPRPLGSRAWRVCNYPGAVNAVVAAAMARFAGIYDDDRVCNVLCGSATLLIERLRYGRVAQAIGCDTHAPARTCAQQNIAAAGFAQHIHIHDWDATKTPLADQSIDLIMADLPFGQLVGTHTSNLQLYPEVLREASRIMSSRGRMVLISHEIRLLEQTIAHMPQLSISAQLQVHVGGMAPVILLVHPHTLR